MSKRLRSDDVHDDNIHNIAVITPITTPTPDYWTRQIVNCCTSSSISANVRDEFMQTLITRLKSQPDEWQRCQIDALSIARKHGQSWARPCEWNSKIPAAVWGQLFVYVPVMEHATALNRVCKYWNGVLQKHCPPYIWNDLFTHKLPVSKMYNALKSIEPYRRSGVKTLTLNEHAFVWRRIDPVFNTLVFDDLITDFEFASTLTRLTLNLTATTVTEASLHSLSLLTALTDLHLSVEHFNTNESSPTLFQLPLVPTLQRLHLAEALHGTDIKLMWPNGWRCLKQFTWSGRISPILFDQHSLPNLEDLTLALPRNTNYATASLLSLLDATTEKLTALRLRSYSHRSFPLDKIPILLERLTYVQTLELGIDQNSGDTAGILQHCTKMKNLQHLILLQTSYKPEEILLVLNILPDLQTVDIRIAGATGRDIPIDDEQLYAYRDIMSRCWTQSQFTRLRELCNEASTMDQ